MYYLTDYLGSVRVTVNEKGDPVGWDDYYPFGLQMPGRTQNASNPNDDAKFTGYLLEQEGDLGIYHAEARMYDPVIGRFMQVDPLASEFPSLTPFHYSYNNPLRFNDPTGLCPAEFGEEICEFLNQFDVFRAFFAQPKDDSDEAVAKVVEQKEHAGMFATAMEEGGELIAGLTEVYSWVPGMDVAIKAAEGDVLGTVISAGLTVGPYKFANYKTAKKWANQIKNRGWSEELITEAITSGKKVSAVNNINPGNKATRYIHSKTGQSIVRDDVTKEIIHIGGPGFKY